jgi:hypothetical protein
MAVNMDKLNVCVGQFVGDLGAAVHSGMAAIGEKLGLYKALAEGPLNSAELGRPAWTSHGAWGHTATPRPREIV